MTANELITLVITVLITAFITTVVSTIVGLVFEKRREKRKQQEEKTDEKQVLIEALVEGVQSLLRAEIIRQDEKWEDRGYCPLYAKDALTTEFKSYTKLKGNGSIPGVYENLMELPDHPPHPHHKPKQEG